MKCVRILFIAFPVLLFLISFLFAQGPDTLWTKTYGGTSFDEGRSVSQTSDGGYIVVGYTGSFGTGDGDIYLIKTDSSGDTLWAKTYDGSAYEEGFSIQETSDSGYIIAGSISMLDSVDFYLIIKTDSNGMPLWTKTYIGKSFYSQCSVQEISEGGYIIASAAPSYAELDTDVHLLKLDVNGDTVWTRKYGGSDDDEGRSVQQTFEGGYIIAGFTQSFGAGASDVYLIKTEPDPSIVEEANNPKLENRYLKLSISPNPFTTSTTITLSLPSIGQRAEGIELNIYDVSGRLVKSVPLTTNHLSLGTDLSPGIYFLKLNGKSVGKAVKVR